MQSNAPYDHPHIRVHMIERWRAMRKQRRDQKDDEYRRRARVARFLTDIDGLREEALRVSMPCTMAGTAFAAILLSVP